MTKYDSHCLIKELINQKGPNEYIKIIPQSDERFIFLTYGRLRKIE